MPRAAHVAYFRFALQHYTFFCNSGSRSGAHASLYFYGSLVTSRGPADISGPVGSTPLSGSSRRHWNISWSKPLKAHAPCVMHIHHACSTVVLGLVLVATGSCDVPRESTEKERARAPELAATPALMKALQDVRTLPSEAYEALYVSPAWS